MLQRSPWRGFDYSRLDAKLIRYQPIGEKVVLGLRFDELSDTDNIPAGGVGFRYLAARLLGLQTGMDFAWDDDGDFAFYITAGSAWH